MSKQKYIGKIFGDYIITEYLPQTNRFKCVCQKCGYIKELTYQYINLGLNHPKETTGQCLCTKNGFVMGTTYNELTLICCANKTTNDGKMKWHCRCSCGNEIDVSGTKLKNGTTKSCGCYNLKLAKQKLEKINNELEDLTNQKFEKLLVIRQAKKEEVQNRPKGMRYWYCLCDCGNYHYASTSDLKTKKVKSCGCLNSQGEEKISRILQNHNIKYQKQYCFEDLFSESTKRKFYFDFGILDEKNKLQYLIEYDGIQHFDKKKQFSKSEETFYDIKRRDEIKNKYCLQNNIPLIRIPYYVLDSFTIEDLKIETTKFLYKGAD